VIDFDGTLNAAISETLGDQVPVTYTPPGGSAIPVLGVFTLITDTLFGDDGTPEENITVATLGLQVSQLPAVPVQGGTVTANGTAYAVGNVDEDGLGWAYLKLNLAG
jgi:hypothetical protein